MTCRHGAAKPDRTTVTLQRGGCTIIFKNVPADVCENCGKYYLDEDVTRELESRAEIAVKNGAEVVIVAYVA